MTFTPNYINALCCFLLLLYVHVNYISAWKHPPEQWTEFEKAFSEKRSAEVKFNDIWRMLTSNGNENPRYPRLNLPLIQSFSMFRPWKVEEKRLHTRPSYASIRINFTKEAHDNYSGVFEADSIEYGLMTFSAGFSVPNLTNFFASSIRLFRDDIEAAALIGAFNLISVPNWNVFDYMICTHYNWLMALPLVTLSIMPPGQGWTSYFNQFGIANLAEHTVNGTQVTKPKFPWALCFVPDEKIRERNTGMPPCHETIDLLKNIRAGDVLYHIWAIKEPYPLVNPSLLERYSHEIGTLETTSNFFTSAYGSRRLLGTHPRFEHDLEWRPDWKRYATPFYLSRAGAVGVYGRLFPHPNVDIEAAQINLYFVMAGIWKVLTTTQGFRHLIVDNLGISSSSFFDGILQYITTELLPAGSHLFRRNSTYPLKNVYLSPDWVIHTINNIALYIENIGSSPSLLPLHLNTLGKHSMKSIHKVVGFMQTNHLLLSNITKGDTEHFQNARTESLHVGNTLFKNVRSLPFNIDFFKHFEL